jgi:hypothetical protein
MNIWGFPVRIFSVPIISTLVFVNLRRIFAQILAVLCIEFSSRVIYEKTTQQPEMKAVIATPVITKSADLSMVQSLI